MGVARNVADTMTLDCSPRTSASETGDGVYSSYSHPENLKTPSLTLIIFPLVGPDACKPGRKAGQETVVWGGGELWVHSELFWCSLGLKFISVKVVTRAVCRPFPGFTMWGSDRSWNWNAVDEGPKRDIVKELEVAVRNRTGLHFGLYYSLFEWFHPLFLEDQSSSFQKQRFPVSKTLPELYELVNRYQPEVLWSDGDGGAPDHYWNSTGFLAWLYNERSVHFYAPGLVLNIPTVCVQQHLHSCGSVLICAVTGPNRYKPCILPWSVFSKNDQKYVKHCQTDCVINLTIPGSRHDWDHRL